MMKGILQMMRQRARFRRLKRDLAHPNLTTAELDELLSDLIHRDREAPRVADELAAALYPGSAIAVRVRATDVARETGASIPRDIDPETYRGGERRLGSGDRRRPLVQYSLPGQ